MKGLYGVLLFVLTSSVLVACSKNTSDPNEADKVIPATPELAQILADDQQISLSWAPVQGAHSYNVYWKTTDDFTNTQKIAVTGTSYQHTSLSISTRYYYHISAVNEAGESKPTLMYSSSLRVVGAPASSSSATLSLEKKTFRFDWTDVEDASHYRLLESPDGISPFVQVGADVLPGVQTIKHRVGLHQRVNAHYILQSCNATGCVDGETHFISGSLNEAIDSLKASNAEAGDIFGGPVALSADGNTLAVSAMGEASAATGVNNTDPGEGDNSLEGAGSVGAGAVYVFRYNEMSGWTQQAYIKASNTDAKDRFGWSIALSEDGNILAVGTFNEGSSLTGAHNSPPWPDDNDAPSSGAVYMFRYSEITGWEQEAYIKASNAQAGDYFGEKLALSADGNTLAVGAWGEDGYGTGINNTDPGQFNDVGSFPDNGAVYVFRYDEIIGWEQQAYIKSSHIFQRDSFGESIALSADGNVLAVGTTRENSVGRGVYTSEPEELDDTHYTSGAVYVFRYTAMTGWVQEAYIKSSNSDIGDGFGRPIALSADGKTLAVSAYNENSGARGTSGTDAEQEDNSVSNSGAVYVFRYIESTGWTQQAYIKASNSDSLDNFGFRIALSADGNTLAVAALWEDSAATGLNGSETEQEDNSANNSGAVYLFRYSEAAAWVQQTYVKAPNTDAEDYFGRSIALSGDGSTLAVGANREDGLDDGTTDDAGVVYLY